MTSPKTIRKNAGRNARIGFVSGNFNVLHPGHFRLLRFAREICDFLVVGVNADDTPGVSVPGNERLENLRHLTFIDHVEMFDEPADRFIARLRPDIVVKGKEFESADNPEQKVVDAYGGKLIFCSGEMRFSSLSILESEFTHANLSTIRKPKGYPERHGFDADDLKRSLARFKGLRVAVIGDLIIDDYITCEPLGMSQEDPTIVVTPIETKTFVGGAGVVAANVRGFGADVHFFSLAGTDASAAYAAGELERAGIDAHLISDATRPTTRKQRFRANGKTLLRVNHLRQHAAAAETMETLLARIEPVMAKTDLVLFADFNYGCLPQTLVDRICEHARERGIMMCADSQASSQLSDISRFKGMKLITPTEREARMAMHDLDSGLAVLAGRVAEKAHAESVIITLGAEGCLIHGRKGGDYATDRLSAFNTAPQDTAGAGDSLFSSMSLALCAGVDIWQSAYIGMLVAGCQTSRVGNTPISLDDILAEIDAPNSEG